MRSRLGCLVFLLACGARTSAPPSTRSGSGSAARVAEARAEQPSTAECEALLTHVLALASPAAADSDRAAVRAELGATFVDDCRAGTRADYDCGRAATSLPALEACQR
ncbi:MAG TPA: hypothetical protein VK427_16345 [Kofleriaceae bacterium]|nr:hypothetical protein [Kofleriaceae bacterium]